MVVRRNIDVHQHYKLCQLCPYAKSVIIYCSISAPGHGKEFVDGLNAIYKHCIYQLMYNFQIPRLKSFDSYILMHSSTQNNDVSLTK